MNRGLQRAGGLAAAATALIFVFVFALVATTLAPMAAPELAFGEYLGMHQAQGP